MKNKHRIIMKTNIVKNQNKSCINEDLQELKTIHRWKHSWTQSICIERRLDKVHRNDFIN